MNQIRTDSHRRIHHQRNHLYTYQIPLSNDCVLFFNFCRGSIRDPIGYLLLHTDRTSRDGIVGWEGPSFLLILGKCSSWEKAWSRGVDSTRVFGLLKWDCHMASAAFIEALAAIDFVGRLLGKGMLSRPLSDSDHVKIKRALRGVKFEVTHRGSVGRKYRVFGLTSQPTRELVFPVDDNAKMKSVVKYFQEMYGFTIRLTHLPCLQVGNQKKANYLPMEACKIVEGRRYTKRLNEKQITTLLKVTCQRPKDRENDILQGFPFYSTSN
ncbi:unnamed protein product [Lactuca virosa]|uniref:PAZ domain-containing protein n=1 Tax=Lactuca virosa TaxID=75947 RepID=A0AAU9NBY8_9ASTR|nr:unnamed protein product [Lactuca virosa]